MKNRHHSLASIMAVAAMLLAAPATAAPTCQTANGETIRCGTAGAMPVGWRLPAEYRNLPGQDQNASEIFKWLQAICAVGVLFAIMAAMPDFDSTNPGEWDREEDNDRRRMP